MRIDFELVPRPLWYGNLRAVLTQKQWNHVCSDCYRKAGGACEACGERKPLHCHERWKYDDDRCVQTLVGVRGLCAACHDVCHAGLAEMQGRIHAVFNRWAFVNGLTYTDAVRQYNMRSAEWAGRNQKNWTQDMSWADKYRKEPNGRDTDILQRK